MRNKHLYPKNWKDIRALVLVRDSFSCQHCKVKQGSIKGLKKVKISLQVAHIDQNRSNNDLTNLICLCPSCHIKMDKSMNNSYKPKVSRNRQIVDLCNINNQL
jgi:5-methylcytosine-specific restriction endonuclease McrA